MPKTRNTDRKRIIKVVFAETVGMPTLPLASASTESKATGPQDCLPAWGWSDSTNEDNPATLPPAREWRSYAA